MLMLLVRRLFFHQFWKKNHLLVQITLTNINSKNFPNDLNYKLWFFPPSFYLTSNSYYFTKLFKLLTIQKKISYTYINKNWKSSSESNNKTIGSSIPFCFKKGFIFFCENNVTSLLEYNQCFVNISATFLCNVEMVDEMI